MFKDIVFNNLGQGLQFGSRWILNLVLITVMDIEAYGLFSFIYTLSNVLYSVLPFGSQDYQLSLSDQQSKATERLIHSLLIVLILFFAVLFLYLCLTPVSKAIEGWSLAIYGIILGFFLSVNLVLFSYFKSKGNFKIEVKSYAIFCVILLVYSGYYYFGADSSIDFRALFISLIGLNFAVTLFAFFTSGLRREFIPGLKQIKIRQSLIKSIFQERLYFGFQEIVTALYTQAGLLILFYFLDRETYGYYRAFFVIISPVMLISVAVSQVVLKHLVVTSHKKVKSFFRRIKLYTLSFASIVCISLFILQPYIFQFIKIDTNTTTEMAFLIIIAVVLLRFVFFNYEVLLIVFDKQKQRFLITLLAVILSIISVFILVPKYGLIGAVSTNLIANAVVAVGLIIIGEIGIKKIYSEK